MKAKVEVIGFEAVVAAAGEGLPRPEIKAGDVGGRINPLALDTILLLPVIFAQSNPICRSFVRDTSITLTCSNTCCTPPTVMLLMTFG